MRYEELEATVEVMMPMAMLIHDMMIMATAEVMEVATTN